MKTLFAIVIIVLFVFVAGCRSTKVAVVTSSEERHTDSVAALRSIGARELTRETEVVTITMRADTLGELREVARDIVRTVTREAEKAIQGDTAVFCVEAKENKKQESKTEQTRQAAERPRYFLAWMWTSFAVLATCLSLYLTNKWTSRN